MDKIGWNLVDRGVRVRFRNRSNSQTKEIRNEKIERGLDENVLHVLLRCEGTRMEPTTL